MSPSSRLLVLDEMDQLDSKSQEVLYTIFEWPYLAGSRLCLVGKTKSGPSLKGAMIADRSYLC